VKPSGRSVRLIRSNVPTVAKHQGSELLITVLTHSFELTRELKISWDPADGHSQIGPRDGHVVAARRRGED
jgi:hypothetical protein